MRQFSNPHSFISLFAFLLLSVFSSAVVAFAGNIPNPDNTRFTSLSTNHGPDAPAGKSRSVFPQLIWLRDAAIEKVFGAHPKSVKPCRHRPTNSQGSSQLPATLLAKYGGDVVLRFNISTPEEEKALSEAADTLFLDVWEFTNNWADIRLRENDVCWLNS